MKRKILITTILIAIIGVLFLIAQKSDATYWHWGDPTPFTDWHAGPDVVIKGDKMGWKGTGSDAWAVSPVLDTGRNWNYIGYFGFGGNISLTKKIRGSIESFLWDAEAPAWEAYAPGVNKNWRYIQLRFEKPAATCNTLKDSETGGEDGMQSFAEWSDDKWIATRFTSGSEYTVCKIVLYLMRTGNPTGTLKAYIYTHDAGENDPNVVVGTGSDTVAKSSIQTGSTEAVTFPNVNATLSDSTTYWVVIEASASEGESDFMSWGYDYDVSSYMKKDDDGSGTWGALYTDRTGRFALYSN